GGKYSDENFEELAPVEGSGLCGHSFLSFNVFELLPPPRRSITLRYYNPFGDSFGKLKFPLSQPTLSYRVGVPLKEGQFLLVSNVFRGSALSLFKGESP
ncbi:MAG: hypothetical protein J6S11_02175, partial [Bacteroidaceae bacterium]|nr:hypothetical protein [Bacteroidaceae bacterium]